MTENYKTWSIRFRENGSAIVWSKDWAVAVYVGASHVELKKILRGVPPRDLESRVAFALWG